MAAPLFTLVTGDGFHSRIGAAPEAMAGAKIIFKASFRSGELVRIDGMERVEQVVNYLDEDGKLNGDGGIQLLANDPSLNLEEPFQWNVEITGVRTEGFERAVKAFAFEAPLAGVTRRLELELPQPGQNWQRGRAGFPIESLVTEGGQLVATRTDGFELDGVRVPAPPAALAYSMTFGR